ncbi:FAD:protein FMN transferase, partial [Streptomyces sp. NPDC060223]
MGGRRGGPQRDTAYGGGGSGRDTGGGGRDVRPDRHHARGRGYGGERHLGLFVEFDGFDGFALGFIVILIFFVFLVRLDAPGADRQPHAPGRRLGRLLLGGVMTAAADWRALGTSVRLVTTDPALLDSCNLLLARYLAEVDVTCSRFREDSELAALDGTKGRPVKVSPLLAEALAVALRAAEATDGAVDPTVGSAMNALGYDRDFRLLQKNGRPVRLTVRPVPGRRLVTLDRATNTVTVPAGIRLDLGATAKAWAADRAATMLAEAAGCGVLVSLGGDTAVAGEPPHGGWRIRVQDATGAVDEIPAHGSYATIGIRSGGLATSGTTVRRWRRGSHHLHHILDPPPWRTVSVAAATCADANAASTAALVKGAGAERWLTHLGLPARLVANDGTVVTTPGWPTPPSDPGRALSSRPASREDAPTSRPRPPSPPRPSSFEDVAEPSASPTRPLGLRPVSARPVSFEGEAVASASPTRPLGLRPVSARPVSFEDKAVPAASPTHPLGLRPVSAPPGVSTTRRRHPDPPPTRGAAFSARPAFEDERVQRDAGVWG